MHVLLYLFSGNKLVELLEMLDETIKLAGGRAQ